MNKGNIRGTIVGLVVLYGGKFIYGALFTSVGIEAMSMAGAGWDESRQMFVDSYGAEVYRSDEFNSVPDRIKDIYINCLADKTVAFLNQTECKYMYNKMTTSEEDHIRQQDLCVAKSGLHEAIGEKHVPECIKVAKREIKPLSESQKKLNLKIQETSP